MKTAHVLAILFMLLLIPPYAYSQLWKQYQDSGKLYQEQQKLDTAIEFYSKAREELKKDSMGTNGYAGVCDSLATLYYEMGQYEKAEHLYLEAKQIREKVLGKLHPDYANSCDNLASLYMDIVQYKKAEQLYLEAKQIREKVLGKLHPDYATNCNDLASLYSEMGQYEKAEQLYLEAKQIREEILGKLHPDYASSCNNLAVLYDEMGQYGKAEQLYLEAKQIQEKVLGKLHPQYAYTCNNLAVHYTDMGQYEKAELLNLEAKQIWEKAWGKLHPVYALSCGNLANLYTKMGQYKKAEPLYLEAKQIREKVLGKLHPEYSTSCTGLAALYMHMGQYEKAEPLYLEAKQIDEKVLGKLHPAYAASCNYLANLYTSMGQYKKAEPLYLEAKQIQEKVLGKLHPAYYKNCSDLANLYRNIKEPEKAKELYTEAFTSQQIQVKNIFRFTSEPEKQDYLRKVADFESYFLSFDVSPNTHPDHGFSYNLSLSQRNLILSSSQQLRQAIYNTTDTSIQNKYKAWIDVRKQLAFWYAKPISDRPDYVQDLELQANTLEKELTRLSFSFRKEQTTKEITWKDILQSLKQDEAAIEFAKFNYYNGKKWIDSTYYVALLLRKNQPEPQLIPLFESRQLNNVLPVSNTSQSIYSLYPAINALYSDKQGVNAAYNLIWKPLDPYLSGIKKIYFAPAGMLFRISLAALPVNEHQLLSDKYELVQLNTTASVVNHAANVIDSSHNIYLYGAIRYDADSATLKQAVLAYNSNHDYETTRSIPDDPTRGTALQYLAGSEKEITEIDSLGKQKKYSIVVLSGDTATEESIKALNGSSSPAVLHIATHGFFFPDPKASKDSIHSATGSQNPFRQSDNPLMRSGLFFAGSGSAWKGKPIQGVEDGILTSYEVSNLYLPNTKLAVLSACQTALGDIQGNEGVYGLQRAFKIAGVQNLVMSLWKVPDRETAEFMQAFYQHIFNHQSIDEAFYNAQTVMKNEYRNEPFKWAAWVLVR
jgi:CHAT domain-containing protein